jgi:hypothetical protein
MQDATPNSPRANRFVLSDAIFSINAPGYSAKDQLSYRVIQSIDAEALIKKSASYFWLKETDLTKKSAGHRQERALVMELLLDTAGLSNAQSESALGGCTSGW